jgi:predicted transcriptional regulator
MSCRGQSRVRSCCTTMRKPTESLRLLALQLCRIGFEDIENALRELREEGLVKSSFGRPWELTERGNGELQALEN